MSINDIELPTFTEEQIQSLTIVNPIEFLSKEENEEIIESIKQSLRDLNNPDKWMTWEESQKMLAEKYGFEIEPRLNIKNIKLLSSKNCIRYRLKQVNDDIFATIDIKDVDKIINNLEKEIDNPDA